MTARRGRPPEPDKRQIELIVAGLVAEARHAGKGVNDAHRSVAKFLGTSVPTVKRACKKMRGDDTANAASNLELLLFFSDESRVRRKKILDAVRVRLAEIRLVRGK